MKTQTKTIQIPLTKDLFATIDAADFDVVNLYTWRAVKYHRSYYARGTLKTDRKNRSCSLHRLIAKTKAKEVCHHRNRNTLDNRRCNLVNMSKAEHKFLHLNNSLIIKFEVAPRALLKNRVKDVTASSASVIDLL